jgi:hypothetical protein
VVSQGRRAEPADRRVQPRPPVSLRPRRLQGHGQGPGPPAEGGRRRRAECDGLRRRDVRQGRRQAARPRPGDSPLPRCAGSARHQRAQPETATRALATAR